MARWFKNRSIRTKLLTGFLLAAFATVVVATVSFMVMTQLSSGAEKMYSKMTEPLRDAAIVAQRFERMRAVVRDLVLEDEASERQKIVAQLAELEAAIRQSAGEFEATILSQEMKQLYSTYQSNFEAYLAARNRIASLAGDGDVQGAIAVLRGEGARTAGAAGEALVAMFAMKSEHAKELSKMNASEAREGQVLALVVASLSVLLAIGAGLWITRMTVEPLREIANAAQSVADGDLTVDVHVRYADEVGAVARSFAAMIDNLRGMVGGIKEISTQVAAASEELLASGTQIGSNAQETSKQCGVVAAAAEQISRNLQTVSAASEEMSSSIGEISTNTAAAAQETTRASKEADSAAQVIRKLGDSVKRIGEVSNIISSIADQTNLLALNATIEAARAGEAGKGFAVVANEVKELAQETQKATGNIGDCLKAVRVDSDSALDAINRIVDVITKTKEITGTIAAAIEEQSVTTQETVRNISECAVGGREITANMTSVAKASEETSAGVVQTQGAARNLSQMAQELSATVSKFRLRVGGDAPVKLVKVVSQRANTAYAEERYSDQPVM